MNNKDNSITILPAYADNDYTIILANFAAARTGEGSSFVVTLPVKQTSEVICNVG